jgi:hypothetical protein
MTGDDPLIAWGRQGTRIWERGDAIALASPNLSRRDRLVVAGSPADAGRLVREVLPAICSFVTGGLLREHDRLAAKTAP